MGNGARRIGICGGTFDPIHYGHLMIAEVIRQQAGLDKVIFMPAGNPPHKKQQTITDALHRYNMVKKAIKDNPAFEISDLEIKREGTTYTIDTLMQLKECYGQEAQIVYIIGADVVLQLTTWKNFSSVFRMCEFAASFRPGFDSDEVIKTAQLLKDKYNAKIQLFDTPLMEISSTDIRHRCSQELSIKYMVPDEVERYIRQNKLYLLLTDEKVEKSSKALYNYDVCGEFDINLECCGNIRNYDLKYFTNSSLYAPVIDKLSTMMTKKRILHSLGVALCCVKLAKLYGCDEGKCALAGLLHDCARDIRGRKAIDECTKRGICIDDIQFLQPELLHGPLGARMCEEVFSIKDTDVLEAIYWHTTGKPNMNMIEKIVFISDYIEPSRDFKGVKKLRKLAEKDLNKALCEALAATIQYVIKRNMKLHPLTVEALNYYI